MSRLNFLTAAVFGIAAAIATLPAYGQAIILIDPAAAEAQAPAYSEQELQQFAGAALTLQRINDDVLPKLEAAGSRAEQHELAQAASIEMVQAVEGRGMSVDRFQEILYQAQTDPALGQRVVQIIENIQR